MRHHLRLGLLLSLGPLVATGCGYPTHWAAAERSLEFDPAAVSALQCETHNGGITTRVDSAIDKIRVTGEVKAGGSSEADAALALEALQLTSELRDGALVLGWDWQPERRPMWAGDVNFDIVLPAALPTRASTHNGNIDLQASGACQVATHNGRVAVTGDVTEIDATSHNGTLTLAGPLRRVGAETHNGAVLVSATGGGRLDGRVETHNGGVELAVAPQTHATVDCSTWGGAISTDATMTDVDREDRAVRGVLGGGDGQLRIVTHNGSIRIGSAESR